MRTTLDIADDVLFAAKERARREKRSAGAVLSEWAREALAGGRGRAKGEVPESFFGFEPFPRRGKVVTNAMIDQLREEENV